MSEKKKMMMHMRILIQQMHNLYRGGGLCLDGRVEGWIEFDQIHQLDHCYSWKVTMMMCRDDSDRGLFQCDKSEMLMVEMIPLDLTTLRMLPEYRRSQPAP